MSIRHLLLAVAVSLLSLALFWSPWLLHLNNFWGIDFGGHGMETVVQNFDGLNFLVVARSLYDPSVIKEINQTFETGNSPIYFAAHFPLFALLIRIFESFLPAGTALLATVILSNILLAVGLYYFFSTLTSHSRSGTLALALTLVALFFPARMLSVRAVGSNEPLFLFFILTSLALSARGRHTWAAILGCLAVLTRSPGIILFGAYALSALISRKWRDYIPYILMPLTLVALFGFYGFRYGDLLAYFHSGDNLHLFFPPFMIFSNTASWVNGMWREDIVYLYLFYALGLGFYITHSRSESSSHSGSVILSPTVFFGLIYGAVILLVSHRDLGRYALPLAPIALLGYAPLLRYAWVRYALAVLLVPIFLLGWQFVAANVQPISDWSPLLLHSK